MDTLRARLATPSFGAWISGDPMSCEVMGRAGYDWLILETQHRGLSPERMLSALQATELGGTPTLVRVGGVEPLEISRALDIGAAGVVVPVVDTAAQAEVITRSMRYPPRGTRSFGYVRGSADDADPICVLMIETAEAIGNLDAIAAVPGVDVLFVGLYDLALSMGVDPRAGLVPGIVAALHRVVEACRANGVTAGCASFGFGDVDRLLEIGMCFVSVGADGAFVRLGAQADARRIAEIRGRERAGA